jgi:hypothetical protein
MLFSDFEVLDICGGFLEKIANSLVCNVWKVYTRHTSASDFFFFFFDMKPMFAFLTILNDGESKKVCVFPSTGQPNCS